jgi:hypothetical protein
VVKSWGFTGANDGSFITILGFVGFTESGVPSDRWRRARTELGRALGEGLRSGYSELYATFPDAHARDDSELENFFRTHTDGNSITVNRMLRTYRSMADIATFEASKESSVQETAEEEAEQAPKHKSRVLSTTPPSGSVTVNINIQLQLPSDATAETFDRFFSSMRTHLISPNE